MCVKVADLPKSTYIEKNIKTEFDVYLNNANDNLNDIIQIESFHGPKHVFSLQINQCPQSDTKSPPQRFFAAFVYEVPFWQSVPRLKRIKTEFDAYLNSANNNFNDVI